MFRIVATLILIFCRQFVFAAPPSTAASNLVMTGTQGNVISVSFTKGDGARRIAIIKQGSQVTFTPANATSYLSNLAFGNGQEVLPGEFVVYNSTGSSFSVTNLVPATEYFIAVFEYNGTGLTTEFLTTSFLTGSALTLTAPALQPSAFNVTNITGNSMQLSWVAGNGAGRIVLAKEGSPVDANPVELVSYTANANFGSGNQVGAGNYVMYKGAGSGVILNNLNPAKNYHFAVFEYNGSSGPVYLTTDPLRGNAVTLPEPTVQASNFVATTIEGDRFSLNWTRGNGSRCIIIAKQGSPVDALPVNGVSYTSHVVFTSAPEIAPGNKVVYNGTGTSMTLSGLSPDSTYHLAIFEYSGSGTNTGYLTSAYPTITQATQPTPTINVTNLDTVQVNSYSVSMSFTPGNGSGRLIVYKVGSAVDFVPTQFSAYNNPVGWNLGNDNKLAYNGTGSSFNLGVPTNSRIYFAAFEYNGNNYKVFNVTDVDTFSVMSDRPPPPAQPSSGISFSSIDGNQFRVSWTKGDGERRVVIVRKDTAVSAIPVDGIQYNSENSFTLAPEIIPGQKVVYDGTGNSVLIDSLEHSTRYYVKIYEYNGSDTVSSYLLSPSLSGSVLTVTEPSISASNIHFKLLNLNTLRVYWKKGSGGKRLILARKNGPVNAEPQDIVKYYSSTYFGSGSKVGDSNYVVFDGESFGGDGNNNDTTYTDVYSVDPGNSYHFAIFEYNGSLAPVYKETDPAIGSYFISFEPLTPATNFRVTYNQGNALSLYWSEGGGDKRVIVAREGQPVDVVPQDGIDYAADKDFRLAPEISSGQRVVYDASGYFTDVEGLKPGTRYYFKIFEYGGTGLEIDYLTSQFDETDSTTLSAPTIPVSNIVFSALTPGSATVSWTNGNGTGRMVVAKERFEVDRQPNDTTNYSWNNYFAYGGSGALGNENYIVYNGTASNFNLLQLKSGTTYFLDVYEYNGSTGPMLLRPPVSSMVTTLGPPQVQAVIDSVSSVTYTSFQLHFTSGSGLKRLVLMKAGSPVDAMPIDNIDYTDNTFFGSGEELGTGNFVVYDGTDDNTIITNLTPGVTYYVTVFEYNIFSSGTILNYLTPSTAIDSFTTASATALPVKWLSFSGNNVGKTVLLEWKTAFEEDNNLFEVERSKDGVVFEKIGERNGAGNSSVENKYSFTDVLPRNLVQDQSAIFYRIKQVDTDKSFSYSSIIQLKLKASYKYILYPNPVKAGQSLQLVNPFESGLVLQVVANDGKVLKSASLHPGINRFQTIDLFPGIYFFRFVTKSGDIYVETIVVQ